MLRHMLLCTAIVAPCPSISAGSVGVSVGVTVPDGALAWVETWGVGAAVSVGVGRAGVGVGVSVGVGGSRVGVAISVGDGARVPVGVALGVIVSVVGVVVGVGVLVSVGVGVGVSVDVAVGVSVGAAQLAESDVVVPSGLATVTARLDPGAAITPMLLTPLSENRASVNPTGVTVYEPLTTVPGLAVEANVNTAFTLTLEAQVTVRASGRGVLNGVGVLDGVGVAVTVGEGVEVGVGVGVRVPTATLLKPSTLLLAPPVTVTVRHAG